MAMTSTIDSLARALDATGDIVAGIRDDQWTNPTPCPEWDVRALLNHLVVGNWRLARILRGEEPPPPGLGPGGGPDYLGDDPVGAYRQSAAAQLEAFSRPGALDEPVVLSFGPVPGFAALHMRITDAIVHGWDLARATGQPARLPEDVAEAEITAIQQLASGRLNIPSLQAFLSPGQPSAGGAPIARPYGAPQACAEDAPAIDRLAALLGRDVSAGSGAETR